jgi:hypothetical protein
MQKQVEIKTVTLLCHKTSEDSQGRSLLCYSTEAGGLGAAISDFEQFRVYLGPVLLQNSHTNMSQLSIHNCTFIMVI